MNKKLKRKQALIMAEPYRTPFNSKVAKVSGDVIEDSVGGIKYATSFDGATKIVDGNKNKIKIKDGVYTFGKSVNLIKFDDVENVTSDNGITYSIKDGVITFSGTPIDTNKGLTLYFNPISINVGDIYSIALFNQFTSSLGFFVQDKSNNGESNIKLGINENIAKTWTVKAGSQYEAIVIYLDSTKTYTNEVIKPILVSGSTIPTKYYSGSYGIKIEVVDGVATCNGMIASDSGQTWWYNFEFPISSGIYSANIFLRSRNINVHLSQDLYDWSHSYQIATKEENTIPKSNINVKTDCKYMFFNFDREYDYDNLVLKPMLVLGTTAPTEFEPNFKNLLEFDDQDLEVGGVKINIKNGIFTLNGTANGTHQILWMQLDTNPVGIYSWNNFGSGKLLFLIGYIGVFSDNDSQTWDFKNDNIHGFSWQIKDGEVYDNYVIKPTLVKSTIIPSQFIPFANPYFVSLGQNGSVQYNGLESREIDLKGNVISKINNQASDKLSNYALTKNTKVVDLGSLEWENVTAQSGYRLFSTSLRNKINSPDNADIKANILCTRYKNETANSNYNLTKSITVDQDGAVIIYDPEYNTSDKLETFKKAIRGALLMYQVKNPTTINTTSFKTFKEDTNATISDDNFTSSPNVITETFKPTRSYDFKVNGFSNVVKSSNLFFLPNITSTTLLGLTYSASNQKMTIKGTATQQYIIVYSFDITDKMNVGKTYVLQCSSGNADLMLNANIKKSDDTEVSFSSYDNKKFTWTSDNTKIVLIIQTTIASGTTIDLSNITFGLYETDNVSIPYEPYFDPYIESFADKKNLLDLSQISDIVFSTKDNQTITYNKDKNGAYLIKDYPLENGIYEVSLILKTKLTTSKTFYYIVSDSDPTGQSLFSNFQNLSLNEIHSKQIQITENKLSIRLWSADGYQEFDFQMMIIKGKTAPSIFLPYQDKYSAFLNVKGKNLFDNANTPLVNLTFNGSNQDLYGYLGYFTKAIYLKKGKYTFKSDKYTIIGKATKWTGEFGSSSVGEVVKAFNATIELEKDMYVLITNNYSFEYEQIFETLIVVEGDQIPEFEPYYSFTKEVLIKQPLRKFDYLTYDGVYRQTNEIVLDGSWNVANNNYLFEDGRFTCSIRNFFPKINNYTEPYSQLYITTTSDLPLLPLVKLQNQKKKGIAVNDGSMIIKLDDSADNSLNNWTVEKVNNYFKQNPITITYKTVDQTFEATSLTRLLFKNGYNKITAFDSINNNAIVEYLEYYKSKGD